jgi:hypothetical protein
MTLHRMGVVGGHDYPARRAARQHRVGEAGAPSSDRTAYPAVGADPLIEAQRPSCRTRE